MRGHPAAGPHGPRGSRGRGHSHPNGPPTHGAPHSHSVHGTDGMRHRHHRESLSAHHPPTHYIDGRRIRPPAHHHARSRGGPLRGRYPRGGHGRGGNFPPPPRHSRQAHMKMMNGHNGGPGRRFPTFNGQPPPSHSGSSMSTPKSTKDSLSDSPAPAALSKSRQSSYNSPDSDSNESNTSAEGNVTTGRGTHSHGGGGGGGHGYNGNHEVNSRGLSPRPPLSTTGGTDASSRGVSPAPQAPPPGPGGQAPLNGGFRNVMFPPNISSFPILKIEAPSLPHVSPVVSYSNGSTPEHSAPSSATAASPNGGPNGVGAQTPPANGRPMMNMHGVNPYHTATGHPVYAWVFVPIIPNAAAPYPPSNAR